jgi:hypothetical protein
MRYQANEPHRQGTYLQSRPPTVSPLRNTDSGRAGGSGTVLGVLGVISHGTYRTEPRVPFAEQRLKPVIQHRTADLEQQVCAFW